MTMRSNAQYVRKMNTWFRISTDRAGLIRVETMPDKFYPDVDDVLPDTDSYLISMAGQPDPRRKRWHYVVSGAVLALLCVLGVVLTIL